DLQNVEHIPLPYDCYLTTWVAFIETICPSFEAVYARNPLMRAIFRERGYALVEPLLVPKISGVTVRAKIAANDDLQRYVAQAVTVVAGVASSLLGALMSEQQFRDYGWLRVALIVTPLIGTLASTFLIQTRVRDLLALREFGREAFQALESRARAEFAAATK